jgi:hypothetical protein
MACDLAGKDEFIPTPGVLAEMLGMGRQSVFAHL